MKEKTQSGLYQPSWDTWQYVWYSTAEGHFKLGIVDDGVYEPPVAFPNMKPVLFQGIRSLSYIPLKHGHQENT